MATMLACFYLNWNGMRFLIIQRQVNLSHQVRITVPTIYLSNCLTFFVNFNQWFCINTHDSLINVKQHWPQLSIFLYCVLSLFVCSQNPQYTKYIAGSNHSFQCKRDNCFCCFFSSRKEVNFASFVYLTVLNRPLQKEINQPFWKPREVKFISYLFIGVLSIK